MQFAPSSPAPTEPDDHRDLHSPITVNDLCVLAWHYDIDRATALSKRADDRSGRLQLSSPPPEDEDDGGPPVKRRRNMSGPSPPKRSASPTKRQRQDSPDPAATPTWMTAASGSDMTPLPARNEWTMEPTAFYHGSTALPARNERTVDPYTPVPATNEMALNPPTPSSYAHLLDVASRTRLVPTRTLSSPTTTKSRTRSPTRNLLNDLRDVVDCHSPNSEEARIPASVHALRRTLVRGFGVRVIPASLRGRLQKKSPAAYEDIPDYAFDEDSPLSEAEVAELWRTVCGILRAARKCKDFSKDENAWCTGVAQTALLAGIGAAGDDPTIPEGERAGGAALEPSLLELNSVQSQSLDPRFLPTLPSTNATVSKKADFTLSFSHDHPSVYRLYRRLSFGGPCLPLSPMTDDYTMRLAAFAGVEVKTAAGNPAEGLTQLAIWMAAVLNNLQMLRETGESRRGRQPDGGISEAGGAGLMPIAGWVVHEHHWEFYVGQKNLLDGGKVTVLGPFSSLEAKTDTYYEIFKLIDLVRRLHAYAREVYWPWLKEQILEPLL